MNIFSRALISELSACTWTCGHLGLTAELLSCLVQVPTQSEKAALQGARTDPNCQPGHCLGPARNTDWWPYLLPQGPAHLGASSGKRAAAVSPISLSLPPSLWDWDPACGCQTSQAWLTRPPTLHSSLYSFPKHHQRAKPCFFLSFQSKLSVSLKNNSQPHSCLRRDGP